MHLQCLYYWRSCMLVSLIYSKKLEACVYKTMDLTDTLLDPQGDARQNKALAGDSHEDSAGSSGEYQASGADASNTEMSESEPSSDYDADLEDDASSCCS